MGRHKGLPFKSGSFLEVYSSHTFEHFSGPELEALLGEIYRVLSPSGSLSCAVPDAERYLKAYASGSSFRDLKNTFQNAAYDTGSTIDIVNYIAYLGGEHRILLDAQILEKMFLSAGFREVGLRSFDSIRDMLDRDHESIYFFGSKSDR